MPYAQGIRDPVAVHPFDQKPDEPGDAFTAFISYRDQGPTRTLRMVEVKGVTPPVATVRDWYQTWRWAPRVKAYDSWIDKVRLEERAKSLAHIEKESAQQWLTMFGEAQDAIAKLLDKARRQLASTDISDVPLDRVVKMMVELRKLQRLEGGLTTDNVEVSGDGVGLSDEDFAKLEELMRG